MQGKRNRVRRLARNLGFLSQTLLFTSSARELPAVKLGKTLPSTPQHPDTPTLAGVLQAKKLHLLTSFVSGLLRFAVRRSLTSCGGRMSPPTKVTTILPGGMSGNFPETPNQIPSAGITKLTTPELQSPVTARLKHFLYTFSARLPLPPSAGLSQQVIPREAGMGLGSSAVSPAAN